MPRRNKHKKSTYSRFDSRKVLNTLKKEQQAKKKGESFKSEN